MASPIRTCIGCRRRGPAAELVRLRRRTGCAPRGRGGARRFIRAACVEQAIVRKCSRAPSNGRSAWPVRGQQRMIQLQQSERGSRRQETGEQHDGKRIRAQNREPEPPAGPRLRVYELAKELNLQPKDLVAKIRAMGIDVANHMSHLEPPDVDRVRRAVERERLENLRRGPAQRHRHPPPLEERRPRRRRSRRPLAAAPAAPAPVVRPAPPPPRAPAPRREPVAPVVAEAEPAVAAAREGAEPPRAAAGRQRAAARGRAPPRLSRPLAAAAPAPTPPPVARRRRRRPRRAAADALRAATASCRCRSGRVKHDPAAGRHRLGRDGRVHPAPRRAPPGEAPAPRFEIKDRDEELRRLGRAPAAHARARPAPAQFGRPGWPRRPAPGRPPQEARRRRRQEAEADPDHHARRAQARHPHGRHHRGVGAGQEDGRAGARDDQEAVGLGDDGSQHQQGRRPRHRDADRDRVRLPDRVDRVPRGRAVDRGRGAGRTPRTW